ncbi:MAG: DUF3619 family protein, partial [Rubrivivax sp.]
MRTTTPYTDIDALQARVASRLVAALSEQASALPHDLSERLRVAREQAVARGREQRVQAPAMAPVLVGAGVGSLLLGG